MRTDLWTIEEDEFLRNNLDKTDSELGKLLGRTPSSIDNHKYFLNLRNTLVKKICPICKKKFKTRNQRRKFCSRLCYQKDRMISDRSRHPKITKKCPECQKLFETKRNNKIYCSLICSRKHQNRVAHPPRPLFKKCAFCGKEFHPNTNIQRFCSYVCNYKFWDAKHPPHPKIPRPEKKCLYCGSLFIAFRKTQKFCSSECRNKSLSHDADLYRFLEEKYPDVLMEFRAILTPDERKLHKSEYSKQYNKRPEVIRQNRERQREYRQRPEVKEKNRERAREWYQRHPEYYQANKEKIKARVKKYSQTHKERIRKHVKEYLQRPEVNQRRRERYRQRQKVL